MGCPGVDAFQQLVAGALDPTTRLSLADHAGNCDDCRELVGVLLDVEPDRVDRYVIERRLGAGAMGVVYAAHDPELDRKVAIKVLRGAGSAARLKREAQMLAKLHHPNVVAVHDAGEYEGRTFVAMALVDGVTLREWLRTPRAVDEIVDAIRQAARGLAAAHAAGVIHRDLKPDNIFVANTGTVSVGDFGLARVDDDVDGAGGGDGPLDLTQTGTILGTPVYMAPEHARGEPTAASDQFSLCVTAWEALHGQRPFAGATFGELQLAIERGVPEAVRDVPAYVHAALVRGLQAKPDDRWPSIDALVAALAPPRRRWPWIAAGAVAVAAAGASAFVLHGRVSAPSCDFSHALDGARSGGAATEAYKRDWIALRTETCKAPRPDDDARVRCLDRARSALENLATSISDSVVRDKAAAATLPRLADCNAARDGDVPLPVRVSRELLLQQLTALDMHAFRGGDANLEALRHLAGEAAKLDFEPAIVQVALVEGDALARSGQEDEASTVLRRALTRAEVDRDDRGVAQLVAALAPVSTRERKLDDATTLLALGDAALARVGADVDIELALIRAHANLAAAGGDHETAIKLVREARAKVAARPGDTSDAQLDLTFLLTVELSAAGKTTEAAAVYKEADALVAKLIPDGNSVQLEKAINEAMLTGQFERSIELSKQLVAFAHTRNEPDANLEAAVTLARAYDVAQDPPKMLAAYQRVAELLDRNTTTPERTTTAYGGIGIAYELLGDLPHAIDPLRTAIAAAKQGGHTLDDERWRETIWLAHALDGTSHSHEARSLLEPLLRELLDNPTVAPHRRAGAELRLAEALWNDGGTAERARARALAADAETDYRAGLERLSSAPPQLTKSLRGLLAETIAWRKHHP